MHATDQTKDWIAPAVPENEDERLAALNRFALLDSPAEDAFDAITRLAAEICGTSIALISLVDRDRQWFKSNHGLTGIEQTPREVSFCGHAIVHDELMEVTDALVDDRFRANPLVQGEPGVRFYAGVPLDDGDGNKLGTLCVLDRKPRRLDAMQRSALEQLARVVVSLFKWRRQGLEAGARLGRLVDESSSEVFVLDADTLRCSYANRGALTNTGRTLSEIRSVEFVSLFPELDRNAFIRDMQALKKSLRQRIDFDSVCRRKDGSTYISRGSLQYHAGEDKPVITAICEDVTEQKRVGRELQRYVDGLTTIISTQQEVSSDVHDLDGLLRLIVVRAKHITRATGAVIEMLEGGTLVYRATTDEILSRIGVKVRTDASLAGLCIREGRALRCNETSADPRVDRESCQRIGARSLVTAPIYREGKPAGALAVYSAEPHAFSDQTVQLVQLLAGTLGSAMQRRHAEQSILEIARAASIETGRDFFKILVTQLAGMIDAEYVFVAELAPVKKRAMDIVAVSGGSTLEDGMEYPLDGSPCETIIVQSNPQCVVASGVRRAYPNDGLLQKLDVEGYVAVSLSGGDRTVIGVLGALFREPIAQPEKAESTLQVFSARAAAELERQRAERNLREQTGVLQSVLDSIADGVLVGDASGRPIIVNPAARRMAGLSLRDDVPFEERSKYYGLFRADGKTLFPPDELPLMQAVRGLATDAVEIIVRNPASPEGTIVSAHGRPLIGSDGELRGGVVVLRDVTQIKRSENEVRTLNRDLEARVRERTAEVEAGNRELELRNRENKLLNNLSKILQSCVTVAEGCDVIAKYGPQLFSDFSGVLYLANPARNSFELGAAWGGGQHSEEVFTHDDCWALRRGELHWVDSESSGLVCNHVKAETDALAYACAPLAAQGGTVGVLYLERRRDAKAAVQRISDSARRLAGTLAEQLALALANIQLRETLRNQSIRDALTGLYNRRFLEESLKREFARAQRKEMPLAMLIVDADHFKRFNDVHGHDGGDYVLQQLGERLGHFIRESDIACRYGGEEFVLLLPGATGSDAAARARALLAEVRKTKLVYQGKALGKFTVSIGLAVYPDHAQTPDELFQAADSALYAAKEAGRDRLGIFGEKVAKTRNRG